MTRQELRLLEAEVLDEESLTLLAIGIFEQRERPDWKGHLKCTLRVVRGGLYVFEDILKNSHSASCIDAMVVIKEVARAFGIEGCLVSNLQHRHFETRSGKILDPGFFPNRSGFFSSVDQYRSMLREKLTIAERLGLRARKVNSESC